MESKSGIGSAEANPYKDRSWISSLVSHAIRPKYTVSRFKLPNETPNET